MDQKTKKRLTAALRWSVAIVGVWWVVSNMSLRDSVLLLNEQTNLPQRTALAVHNAEDAVAYDVIDPTTQRRALVPANRIVNPAGKVRRLEIMQLNGQIESADLVGMQLSGDINRSPAVKRLLVQPVGAKKGEWIDTSRVKGGFVLDVPRPRVEVGIISMIQRARTGLLLLAVAVFPITFIITSYRWEKLLQAVGVMMGLWRAFSLTMVGAFYNTFMPGSTGGDVLKAIYAAKQTPNRMAAVMSVVIDRILGLLALVMVGGVMAAYQYVQKPTLTDPTSRACFGVALVCVFILAVVGIGLAILFQPGVRRMLGLEFILSKLPMQRQIDSARSVLRMYRARPVLVLWALLVTIPVHVTGIVSAMLAGKAFGLPIRPLYYFTAVPVIVLAGSIPISPQGAGVMEFFAVALTQKQGTTVSQAFALTMSIRVVQIFWNLTGGIFVFFGGFHAPTAAEQSEVNDDAAVGALSPNVAEAPTV